MDTERGSGYTGPHMKLNDGFSMRPPATGFAPVALFAALLIAAAGCSRTPPGVSVAEGRIALTEGRYEDAIPHLRAAARAFRDSPAAWYNLGMANLMAGHNRAAEKALRRAVDLSEGTDDTDALSALGEARRRRHHSDLAAAAYRVALEKAFRKPRILAGLAACELDQGNVGAAERLLAEALQSGAKDPVVLFNSGVLHARPDSISSDPSSQTKAANCFVGFLRLSPPGQWPEKREEAVRRLAELNAKRPAEIQERVDELLFRAAAADRAGQTVRACELASDALNLDPSNPDCLARQVSFLRKRGRAGDLDKARANEALGHVLFPSDVRFAPPTGEGTR